MRKGKRVRLAKGIFQDGNGRCVVFRGHETRFPPDTPMELLHDALAALKRKLKGSGAVEAIRGTLAEAVDRWEPQEKHLASWMERRAELRAWVDHYGHVRLTAIKAGDVRRVISAWSQAGLAPKTIRNRLWSLKHLYKITLGPKAETPCDDVEPPAKVRSIINPTSVETILTVYANLLRFEQDGRLHDAKTRARFMVRATSGRRPVEIMRAKPEDVDLERRIWRVRDAKGGWSEGQYLDDDALVAWQTFREADAWGDFSTGSMAEVLRYAGWPTGVRPYNLRHSVGMALSEAGHDLADVGAWLGQTDIRTTRRSYVPVLQSRMQRMGETLSGRFGGWNPPTVPRQVPRSGNAACLKLLKTQGRSHGSETAKINRK